MHPLVSNLLRALYASYCSRFRTVRGSRPHMNLENSPSFFRLLSRGAWSACKLTSDWSERRTWG